MRPDRCVTATDPLLYGDDSKEEIRLLNVCVCVCVCECVVQKTVSTWCIALELGCVFCLAYAAYACSWVCMCVSVGGAGLASRGRIDVFP